MATIPAKSHHGIKDNHRRGRVADFLSDKISQGSRLSVVSAYFTIYAYEALSQQLDGIESLQFLFGEPRFIQALDPDKTDKKAFKIEDEGLALANRLQQKEIARRCAEWITSKVEIRSIRETNLLHGKLYHIDDGRREHALMGSSNFTSRGLGLSGAPNIELNMVIDSDRDRADLKGWFDELWSDKPGARPERWRLNCRNRPITRRRPVNCRKIIEIGTIPASNGHASLFILQ